MLQKDHLMRLFTQFQNVMSTVLALRRDGRFEEALREAGTMMQQLVALDAEQLGSVTESELIDRLNEGDHFDVDRALMTADLLSEEADIHHLDRRADAGDDRNRKALALLLEVYLSEPARIPADFFDKVENSLQQLAGRPLSSFVMWRLFRFFEKTGRYDRAENALFQLAGGYEEQREDVRREGDTFYDRLEERTDDELRRGNLPRDEVEEGRREFNKLVD